MSTSRPSRSLLVAMLVVAVGVGVGACSSGNSTPHQSSRSSRSTTSTPSATKPALPRPFAVGRTGRTFTDTSRATPAGPGRPETTHRTLDTTILYPAAGDAARPTDDAAAATTGAPFPLVVLGHGLGGNVEYLTPLAERWAAAGFVVAMPRFPLTHAGTPGGIAGADVQNQPADVSFVIDQVLAASHSARAPLGGLVDETRIGVSGHSNGGITTLGVVANSCCRDKRIAAAVVLSGTPGPFAGGTYDFSRLPPIMFVHGVADQFIDYNQTVETFNDASTPKALLTLARADHSNWLITTNEAFDVAARATIDFLDAYLRDDQSAVERLPSDEAPPLATMHFARNAGSASPVATVPAAQTDRRASISADTALRDGQVVTVTWSGFLPGKTVNVLQCVGDGRGGTASCGIAAGHVLVADPTGSGSIDLTVHTGAFANGVCDATHPCTVLVNDSGLLDEDASRRFPVTFAG